MSDDMNLSINGQSQVPPGFRFHPTEEELLHYYLRKKVAFEKIDLDVIREVDLNKLEPWDIQEKCKIGSTPQNDWYFFSHKDKKYPTGTRTNRATAAGFWKATGRDKIIYSGFKRIGLRKTLVFYKGRAPHGQKSDWIMHEYRLDETNQTLNDSTVMNPVGSDPISEDGWVVCRVFKKKNYQKSIDSPKNFTNILNMENNNNNNNNNNNHNIHIHSNNPNRLLQLHHLHHLHQNENIPYPTNDGVLDQILLYMGRTCKLENDQTLTNIDINNNNNNSANMINHSHHDDDDQDHDHDHHDLNERFIHLPRLESPTLVQSNINNQHYHNHNHNHHLHATYNPVNEMLLETDHGGNKSSDHHHHLHHSARQLNDWIALDRLVASQLNGQDPNVVVLDEADDVVQVSSSYNSTYLPRDSNKNHNLSIYGGEADLWSNFAARSSSSPSSSDPLCHLSV